MACLNRVKLPHAACNPTSGSGPADYKKSYSYFKKEVLSIPKEWSLGLNSSMASGERIQSPLYERKRAQFRFLAGDKGRTKRSGCAVRCTAEGIEGGLLVGRRDGVFLAEERFRVVALVAAVMCLCNADRVVMSVAIVPLAAKHGWSNSFLGIVQSSFLWGYVCSSVIGGALVDKYGGKRVITWGAALWSLATLLTPWAANHSTVSLLAMRAFFGLAEGVALPSMNNLLARWFPTHERATAVGISMGGFQFGNVVGLVLAPLGMSLMGGISGPFILFSSLGLLWVTMWTNKVANSPQESSSISKSELRLIQAGKSDAYAKKTELPSIGLLLSKLPTWAIIFANITNNWGYFVLLSWMPVYFKTVFEVNLKQAAWFSAVPWGTMAISGYIAGTTSDYLIKSGYSTTSTRKIMQSIGFIGPGIALLCLNFAKTPSVASIFLTAALSLSSFSQAGFLLNMEDIAPQYAGFLHGISNSAGTLAAIISTVGTGFFVQWLGLIWQNFQLVIRGCLTWKVSRIESLWTRFFLNPRFPNQDPIFYRILIWDFFKEMNFRSMEEFWSFYMSQHSKPGTRRWHFAGTLCSILCLVYSLLFHWWLLIFVPVIGYGFAWYSHFFVEGNGNVPATFEHPVWSLLCDYKMFGLMLTGQMDREIKRLGKRPVLQAY